MQAWDPQKALDPLDLELQAVESHYVGIVNQTQVLWKQSVIFSPNMKMPEPVPPMKPLLLIASLYHKWSSHRV